MLLPTNNSRSQILIFHTEFRLPKWREKKCIFIFLLPKSCLKWPMSQRRFRCSASCKTVLISNNITWKSFFLNNTLNLRSKIILKSLCLCSSIAVICYFNSLTILIEVGIIHQTRRQWLVLKTLLVAAQARLFFPCINRTSPQIPGLVF